MNDRPIILVVDDETKIRRLVSLNLEIQNFDVISAADGMYAIEIFEKTPRKPDLILLDVMMPEMDGFQCARKIRELSDVPIIFMTAKVDNESKLQGFDLGADDYITKPFSIEELIARIKAVLRRSRSNSNIVPSVQVLNNGPMRLCVETHKFEINNVDVHLSDTEFRLMKILMETPGVIHTHQELLRSIWGARYIDDVQYLRVTFTRLRHKFEEAGLERGVISAYSSVGYILQDLQNDELSSGNY